MLLLLLLLLQKLMQRVLLGYVLLQLLMQLLLQELLLHEMVLGMQHLQLFAQQPEFLAPHNIIAQHVMRKVALHVRMLHEMRGGVRRGAGSARAGSGDGV